MTRQWFDGVPRRPWYKKINPIWWFGNDNYDAVGKSFYYKYIRNPAQNFRWYVIGVVDRGHWASGRDPLINQRSDMNPPAIGWCLSVVLVAGLPLLPYVSYSSPGLTWYAGWQPSGGFGLKLNLLNGAYT